MSIEGGKADLFASDWATSDARNVGKKNLMACERTPLQSSPLNIRMEIIHALHFGSIASIMNISFEQLKRRLKQQRSSPDSGLEGGA